MTSFLIKTSTHFQKRRKNKRNQLLVQRNIGMKHHLLHHLKIPAQILMWSRRKVKRNQSSILCRHMQLQYDGKSNWLHFKHKFIKYAKSSDWTAEECLDCLSWCLTGKAADFCATSMERTKHLSYRKLLKRLDDGLVTESCQLQLRCGFNRRPRRKKSLWKTGRIEC